MAKRNRKGQFVKGGHHSRSIVRHRSSAKPSVVVVRTGGGAAKHHKRKSHGGRRKHGSGGPSMLQYIVTGLGAGALLASPNAPASVQGFMAKVPGAKTFGPVAVAGAGAFLIDRYLYKSKWLKALAVVGAVSAAIEVGKAGKDFKWLGDEGGDPMDGNVNDLADVE